MRATTRRCAIFAALILALSGCRSGGSGWSWGRKRADTTGAANTMPSGPQLPSANAAPSSYAPNYAATGATGAGRSTAVGGYSEQNLNPYQSTAYPGQPAGYSNVAPGATGTIPNAAAPGGNYGAMPNAANPNAAQAAPIAPQAGPYNENYGQPAAGAPAAASVYPTSATPGAYQPPAGQTVPGQNAQAYPSTADAYGTPVQSPAGGAYAQAPGGTAAPATAGGYGYSAADPNAAGTQTADNRYASDRYASDRYGSTAQPEQPSADRYAAANAAAGDPATPAATSNSDRYQPGNTGYQPGNTGYNPPGVPPYQSPGQDSIPASPRREPNYRPGGTSDYIPAGGSRAAAPAADRYGAPANYGAPPTDANGTAPAGHAPAYQPPSTGGY